MKRKIKSIASISIICLFMISCSEEISFEPTIIPNDNHSPHYSFTYKGINYSLFDLDGENILSEILENKNLVSYINIDGHVSYYDGYEDYMSENGGDVLQLIAENESESFNDIIEISDMKNQQETFFAPIYPNIPNAPNYPKAREGLLQTFGLNNVFLFNHYFSLNKPRNLTGINEYNDRISTAVLYINHPSPTHGTIVRAFFYEHHKYRGRCVVIEMKPIIGAKMAIDFKKTPLNLQISSIAFESIEWLI